MKASELMIGDWIDTAEGMQKVTAVFWDGEVRFEKDGMTFRVFEDADDEEYFAPVPLTPGILEKNGWLSSDEPMVEFFGVGKQERKYKRIEFVHQLQHALRLCGIKKEIVL